MIRYHQRQKRLEQLITRTILTDHHRRLRHRRMRPQRRLHLTQLNPETTQLHLIVNTTNKLQLPVITPPHHITSAIHPRTLRPERIRNKTPSRQTRTIQITPRHTQTSHIQLTRNTRRNRQQTRIQH
ncbi:hypothetical protein CLV70_1731, partial [Pseudosporangium ferrugineum]